MFSTFKSDDATQGRSGKSSAEKMAKVKELMQRINKKEGSEVLSLADSDYEVERVSTGILPLDLILGGSTKTGYGFPKGKIIEVYGPEHSGKTSLMNALIASVQSQGGIVLYVAGEDGMDPVYARKFGVKIEDVVFLHPTNAESGFETTINLLESGLFSLIVIDSVVSMVPKVVQDNDFDKREMGNLARLITTFCTKAQPLVKMTGTTLIAINQLRDNITSYGGGTKTSGGRALKHYSAIRLELKNPGKDRYTDPETKKDAGIYVTCYTKKNRHNTPFQSAMFPLLFETGIDKEANLFMVGKDMDIITRKGAWYVFDGQQFQGETKFIKKLKDDQEFRDKLDFEIKSSFSSKKSEDVESENCEDDEDEEI